MPSQSKLGGPNTGLVGFHIHKGMQKKIESTKVFTGILKGCIGDE